MSRPAAELRAVFEAAGATGVVHAVDVRTGAEVGLHPDAPVVAASVFKLPILLELYRQVAAGTLRADEPVRVPADRRTVGPTGLSALRDDVHMSLRDLATLMIAVSDNTAADVVAERVGLAAVNATLRALGCRDTVLVQDCQALIADAAGQLGEDGLARLAADEVDAAELARLRVLDPACTNRTTARDCTTLLRLVWRDEAATPEACAEVREVLGLQVWPHRLRSGFPGRVRVSGKTGTLPGVRNEVGVVEYPDGEAYAVAVFTRAHSWDSQLPAVDASIGAAAALAVDHLRAGRTPATGTGAAAPSAASG